MYKKFKDFKARLGKWFWVLLIAVIALAAFMYFRSRGKAEPQKAEVNKGTVKAELILTGSVTAEKFASLTFPASGKIAWVAAKEGQSVKRGTPITSLDKTVLNSIYQDALNDYRNYQAAAEQVLDSVKGHDKDETFSQKAARTTAEVNRDNAFEAVKSAKYNLDNATIYAPFDGVISSLPFTSPGVQVILTDVQVVIVDPATIYFDVDADQNDVTSLNLAQNAEIVLDSFPDKNLTGKISFISLTPKTNQTGTNYKVKVEFSNPGLAFSPRIGMTGDARFILQQKDNVLFIPSDFVNTDKKGKFVYKGEDRQKVYIKTGLEGETVVEVTEGLSEKEIIYE